MGGRRSSILALAAAALTAFTACSTEDAPLAQPSSAFPDVSPPTPAGATGSVVPTGPSLASDPGVGELRRGTLTLEVSGELEARRTLGRLIATSSSPPPGGIAVVWTAGGTAADTVGLGGASFLGTRSTAPALTLTITVQTPEEIETFVSLDGECTITLTVARSEALEGRFACRALRSANGILVDAAGDFSAAG